VSDGRSRLSPANRPRLPVDVSLLAGLSKGC
jgi:hypothetical protein